jgi:hypothetical protein
VLTVGSRMIAFTVYRLAKLSWIVAGSERASPLIDLLG